MALRILMLPDFRESNPYQALLADALGRRGVEVRFPRSRPGLFVFFRSWRHEKPRPDLIHLHWLNPWIRHDTFWRALSSSARMALDIMLIRLFGPGYVWTAHNLVSHDARFWKVEEWMTRLVARWATRVIVHSHEAKRDVVRQLGIPPHRVAFAPHGDYLAAYGEPVPMVEARRQLGLPSDAFVLLHPGLIRPYKGIEELIALWRSIPKPSKRRAILLVAGEAGAGDYRERLLNLCRGDDTIQLRFGRIADRHMAALLGAANVIALPYRRILTSGSLILALSYGRAVLAPAYPVIRETVGGFPAFLYAPESNDGMREALEAALASDVLPSAEEIGNFLRRHEWGAMARIHQRVYTRAARIRRAAAPRKRHPRLPAGQ